MFYWEVDFKWYKLYCKNGKVVRTTYYYWKFIKDIY